jgi:hypothetical protein
MVTVLSMKVNLKECVADVVAAEIEMVKVVLLAQKVVAAVVAVEIAAEIAVETAAEIVRNLEFAPFLSKTLTK